MTTPKRSEAFGRLLKAGIASIANCEGKTAPVIEDELGVQIGVVGKSIQRYKSGYLPPDSRTVQILAEACVRRGFMNRDWLQSFLHAARYHQSDKLLDQLCPLGPARPRLPRIYENLPAPTYSQFVMRPQAFADVSDGLQQRSAAVLIVGLGGNGKTSLAREIAADCLRDGGEAPRFESVVWVSDKDRSGTTNLSTVLDEIARTLEFPGFTQCEYDEKRREVEHLLKGQRVLLVVDNFETITDGALLTWLLRMPEPSKVIITTRENRREFQRGGWLVELRGMSEAEAQTFIQQRLRLLKMEAPTRDPGQLTALMQITGGNPKAIEISLGLIKQERRPLQQIIDDLYVARGDLFEDLFVRAWRLLDETTQRILFAMLLFPDSASGEALRATAAIGRFQFDRAVERLVDLALLDTQQPDMETAARYTLHPLVRAFASARMKAQPELERTMRIAWSQYFVAFTTEHTTAGKFSERYWDTLFVRQRAHSAIYVELTNVLHVLAWADTTDNQPVLVALMLRLAHLFAFKSLFLERVHFARRAAAAAHALAQFADEALLRIDALGWVLTEMDRLDEARGEIEQGICVARELIPDPAANADLLALGYAFLSRAYLREDKIDDSRAWIEEGLKITSSNVVYQRVLEAAAEVERKRGHYQAAIELYKKSRVVAEPYANNLFGGVLFGLGFCYLGLHDFERAQIEFEQILDWDEVSGTDIAQATYGLALIAETQHAFAEARTLARKALDVLSRLRTTHWLLGAINVLLKRLESSAGGGYEAEI